MDEIDDIVTDKKMITEQYAKLRLQFERETSFGAQAQAVGGSNYLSNQDYITL